MSLSDLLYRDKNVFVHVLYIKKRERRRESEEGGGGGGETDSRHTERQREKRDRERETKRDYRHGESDDNLTRITKQLKPKV